MFTATGINVTTVLGYVEKCITLVGLTRRFKLRRLTVARDANKAARYPAAGTKIGLYFLCPKPHDLT